MAAGGFCGIAVVLVMIMRRGVLLFRIRLRSVLMLMSVTVGGMAASTGDCRRIGRHTLQRQGNQQYRNQQCAEWIHGNSVANPSVAEFGINRSRK